MTGPVSSGSRSARRVWIALAVALAARLAALIPAVIDDDEAWFAASARALHRPWDFFRLAPDNKPPGTVWFYEAVAAVFGPAGLPRTARLVGLVLLIATCALLFRLARRSGSGARAALLFALASGALAPQLFALTNEQLMVAPIALAVFAALELRGLGRWLLAGAAIGLACWVKQTGIVFLLPVLLACDSLLAAALAVAACLAVVAAQVLAVGPHAFWEWTFVYPREVLVRAREVAFGSWSDALSSVAIAAAFLFPLWRAAVRGAREGSPRRRVLLGWVAAAALAIAAGKGLFLHYYLLALPPVCLLAASVPPARWADRWLWTLYAAMLAIASVPLSALFWGNDLGYFGRVARRIEQLTSKDDRVFVWSGSPVPAALADRAHATPFVNARFLIYPYGSAANEALFRDALEAAPPALFVDLHARGDNRIGASPEALPWLGPWLAAHYTVLADPSLPWARFYLRRDRSAPRGLCASSPLAEAHDEYPRSLAALRETIAGAEAHRYRLTELLALDEIERSRFALESLETACRLPEGAALPDDAALADRTRALFAAHGFAAPLALASRAWWIELAIVELQPVVPPRK